MASTTENTPITRKRKRIPSPKKEYRTYTDEERAHAIATLLTNKNNYRGTAKKLGIPVSTLTAWVKDGVKPVDQHAVLEKMVPLCERVDFLFGMLCTAFDPAQMHCPNILDWANAVARIGELILEFRTQTNHWVEVQYSLHRTVVQPADLTKLSYLELIDFHRMLLKVLPSSHLLKPPKASEPRT